MIGLRSVEAADPRSPGRATVGVSRAFGVGWRTRYRDKGLPGLDDDPSSGRRRTVQPRPAGTSGMRNTGGSQRKALLPRLSRL
jgi:hypothetical protein